MADEWSIANTAAVYVHPRTSDLIFLNDPSMFN